MLRPERTIKNSSLCAIINPCYLSVPQWSSFARGASSAARPNLGSVKRMGAAGSWVPERNLGKLVVAGRVALHLLQVIPDRRYFEKVVRFVSDVSTTNTAS